MEMFATAVIWETIKHSSIMNEGSSGVNRNATSGEVGSICEVQNAVSKNAYVLILPVYLIDKMCPVP